MSQQSTFHHSHMIEKRVYKLVLSSRKVSQLELLCGVFES